MNVDLVQCTHCKVKRRPENFIGKKGGVVKRCLRCRETDDKSKKRPDIIEKRNERQRTKKYYIGYRERKREGDEDAFLRHNADNAKKWRENNREHVANWRTTNVNYRLKAMKDQAKNKGYSWDEDMTRDVCAAMMTSPCFYCSLMPEDTVNGIDRMDNTRGYSTENCVACCKNCNFIKKCLDPRTFVNRCVHVASCHGHGTKFYPQSWPNTIPSTFWSYKDRAYKKNLDFDVTEEEYCRLRERPCHYCHRNITVHNLSGMDRIDNSKGYSLDNVVACCSECNQARSNIPQAEFIHACILVSQRADSLILPEIPVCLRVITRRKNPSSNA
jgi:hypothetical protein